MRKITFFLLGVMLLTNSGISFGAEPKVTLEWRGGNTTGSWHMLPGDPNTKDSVVFAGPGNKTYSNSCFGGIEIPSTPTVVINNSQKLIQLVFAPPLLGVYCPLYMDPVYAYITVEAGPLVEGQWRFESFHPSCSYATWFYVGPYSGGDGSAANPWRISNKADLLAMGSHTEHYSDYFVMTSDVNLIGEVYTTAIIAADTISGVGFQGKSFCGVFDGQGFKIIGMTIDGGDYNYYLGLFGKIYGGEVKNLGLENGYVNGVDRVGGLVGWNYQGNISNCYAICDIDGWWYAGGLVGWNYSSNIYNSCSLGDISGSSMVGGLVGYANGTGVIAECNAGGEVCGDTSVGGLVGQNDNCNIEKCYSTGTIFGWQDYAGGLVGLNIGDIFRSNSTSSVMGYSGVGGLVGLNHGIVSNCYAKGEVVGIQWVGGLTGYNDEYSAIEDCYFSGNVNGSSDVGGLAGGADYLSNIANCYSAGDVNGIGDCVGGLVGINYESSEIENCFWNTETQSHGLGESIGYNEGGTVTNVAGMGISQMQKKITYTTLPAEWDFVNVWGIGEGQTYPYLRQYSAGDINQDSKVDYLDLAEMASQWLTTN